MPGLLASMMGPGLLNQKRPGYGLLQAQADPWATAPNQPHTYDPSMMRGAPEQTAPEQAPVDLEQIDVLSGDGQPDAGGEEYVLKRGDTLSQLALERYGNADFWKQIAAYNGISERDTRRLKIGQVILIPPVEQMGADNMAPEGPTGMAQGAPMAPLPRANPMRGGMV